MIKPLIYLIFSPWNVHVGFRYKVINLHEVLAILEFILTA